MPSPPIYQRDEEMRPDGDFEAGRLEHLLAGKSGRLLDPRRTPVTIVDVRPAVGMFVVRIDAFEDTGALWEVPFEQVRHYQFERGGAPASAGDVAAFREAIARFDRPLQIPRATEAAAVTQARLESLCEEATAWLDEHSSFLRASRALPDPESRQGDPLLWADLQGFMNSRGLGEMEDRFARQFVSNPGSGEMIKGHRIVIAETGLADYAGTVIRDPGLFDGDWSRERRALHILARMAFVRSLFGRLGHRTVTLYRGLSTDGPLRPDDRRTFVSTTFSLSVAKAHFDAAGEDSNGVLYRRVVPVERLFMTFHETEQMNRHFREAEAVLLQQETP